MTNDQQTNGSATSSFNPHTLPFEVGVKIAISDFFKIPPGPGHRNSEERAQKAVHLHKLLREHMIVDLARVGNSVYCLTGNTRSAVWQCKLSDAVPPYVYATIFTCADDDEMKSLMLHFDSKEEVWTASDFVKRAVNLTFGGQWSPTKATMMDKVGRGTRLAEAVSMGHYRPPRHYKIEHVMPHWKHEIMALDVALEVPLAKRLCSNNPYRAGFLAGFLMLYRTQDCDAVRRFIVDTLSDRGTIDPIEGYDGTAAMTKLIEDAGSQLRGRPNEQIEVARMTSVIQCFLLTRDDKRIELSARGQFKWSDANKKRKFDLLDYFKEWKAGDAGTDDPSEMLGISPPPVAESFKEGARQ